MPKPSGYSSDLASTDTLSKDLHNIIMETLGPLPGNFEHALKMKLTSYIVRRDHKVHNHAYKLGKGEIKR